MSHQRFETGKTPHIHITEVTGELVISGWIGSAVEVTGAEFSAEMTELDRVKLASAQGVEVLVPSGASLSLDQVHGPVIIKHVNGTVDLNEATGQITLRDVGDVSVIKAHETFSAENLSGPLFIREALGEVEFRNVSTVQIERSDGAVSGSYVNGSVELSQASGTVILHTVNGPLTIRQVSGDVILSNLGDNNDVTGVGGKLHLAGGLMSGEHTFSADGDIIVRWPVDAPVRLTAIASEVQNRLPLEDLTESVTESQTTLTGHIEEGKAQLTLNSQMRIGLIAAFDMNLGPFEESDFEFDFDANSAELEFDDATISTFSPPAPVVSGSLVPGKEGLDITITAAIVRKLAETSLQMDVASLEKIVSAAVAEGLEEQAGDPSPITDANPMVDTESVSMQQADDARRAVERSLQQAEDSMEIARRQSLSANVLPPSDEPSAPLDAELVVPPPDQERTAEERNQILQLLKEGHISIQQANTLLDALLP